MITALRGTFVAAVAALTLAVMPARGQEADTGGGIGAASGSLRAGYWSSNRKLDDRNNFGTLALWMRGAPRLNSNASVVVEGWVRSENLPRDDHPEGLLREAYLDLTLGSIDFRIGKQIVVWGRADAINPTDNISPRNLTLLVPDDDDQRFGTYAFSGKYYLDTVSLTAMWLPGFQGHIVPIPALPAPLVVRDSVPKAEDTLGQGAFKLEQAGGAVDWSLSYFDGYDRSPDLGLGPASATEVQVLLRHHRIRVMGGDVATTAGRFGLRAEVAFTLTEEPTGSHPEVKKPFFFGVVGADRTFSEYLNVNAQYLLRVVTNYDSAFDVADPAERAIAIQQASINQQLDRIQQGGTLRISDKWLNETLEADVSGAFYVPRFDYALRAKVAYAFTDRWKGIVGGDYFGGETPSFFRNLDKNSTAFVELRMSF